MMLHSVRLCFVAVFCLSQLQKAASGEEPANQPESQSPDYFTITQSSEDDEVDSDAKVADSQREDDADSVEDSFYDPLQADPDCNDAIDDKSCWSPPGSTIDEEERVVKIMDASCSFGGDDPDQALADDEQMQPQCAAKEETVVVDQHWGSDPQILRMRNKLRDSGSGVSGLTSSQETNRRPPIFLMPGLASTRLVAWRYKSCPQHPLLSDIKVLDYGTSVEVGQPPA